MLRDIKIATAFLTVVRPDLEPYPSMEEIAHSAWAFPLVGLALGMLLALFSIVSDLFLSPLSVSVIVLLVWAVLTGALHIDGWCDCWDALAAETTTERRLEIMKDSRMGTFGAVALFFLLTIKVASIYQLSIIPLIAAPVIGRSMMIIVANSANFSNSGIGSLFKNSLQPKSLKFCIAAVVICSLTAGLTGIIAGSLAYIAASGFASFAQKRLGNISGDVLGAICELSEAVFLLVCAR